jgi:hypothetical protein
MNDIERQIANQEAMLTKDRQPRFILRAIPRSPKAVLVSRTKDEALWIADRIVQVDIFAPGLKNYDLIPNIDHGDYYYYFMGDADSPISFVKILSSGILIYGAPAFTPIGFDVYPEMILAYIPDFLSLCKDMYGHLQYKDAIQIQLGLNNVAGIFAKISRPAEWRPIVPAQIKIHDNIILAEIFQSAQTVAVAQVRRLLNRFFSAIGLPGRYDDTPLPRDFENQFLKLG